MLRRTVTLLVATVMAATVIAPSAAGNPREGQRWTRPTPIAPEPLEEDDFEAAVRVFESAMTVGDDGLLAVDTARVDGVDAALRNELARSMEVSNELIRSGLADAEDLFGADEARSGGDRYETDRHCRGRSGFRTRWWGYRLYLNSCQTSRIKAFLSTAGGSLTVLCASFSLGAVACAFLGGALTILGGTLEFIGGARRGIKISQCWVCPVPLIARQ